MAILIGDEEKLLVLALVLSFGQADLESLNQTKRAIFRHVSSLAGEENKENQLLQRSSPFSAKLRL